LEEAGKIERVNKTFATFAAIGMCSWTSYWFDFDRQESGRELADTSVNIFFKGLREKARMPRALHGDEWSMLVWGCEPPSL
jgi:hypothetical protein